MTRQKALEILGLGPNASLDEAKAAYRMLAKAYHPDKNPASNAAVMFRYISDAWKYVQNDTEIKRKRDAEEARRHAEARQKRYAEEVQRHAEARRKRDAEEARRHAEARQKRYAEEVQRHAEARRKRDAEEARRHAEARQKRYAEEVQRHAEARRKRDKEAAQKRVGELIGGLVWLWFISAIMVGILDRGSSWSLLVIVVFTCYINFIVIFFICRSIFFKRARYCTAKSVGVCAVYAFFTILATTWGPLWAVNLCSLIYIPIIGLITPFLIFILGLLIVSGVMILIAGVLICWSYLITGVLTFWSYSEKQWNRIIKGLR